MNEQSKNLAEVVQPLKAWYYDVADTLAALTLGLDRQVNKFSELWNYTHDVQSQMHTITSEVGRLRELIWAAERKQFMDTLPEERKQDFERAREYYGNIDIK